MTSDAVVVRSLEPFTAAEARAHTDKIAKKLDELADLIIEAWHRRAWEALGYESWADYCAAEFDTDAFALKGQERDDTILRLRAEGMSNRAIAAATGTNRETVRQVGKARGNILPPALITGTDGKTYTRKAPSEPRNVNPDADIRPRDPSKFHTFDGVRFSENKRFEQIRDEIDSMVRNLENGNEDHAWFLLNALKSHIDRLIDKYGGSEDA